MRSNAVKTKDQEPGVRLQKLAQEIVSEVTKIDPFHRKELLGTFIAEMYSIIAEQERRVERSQKYAEAAAAAKARGVHIGQKRYPLPEGFEEMAEEWFNGRVSAAQAGKELGISRHTFTRRATEWVKSAEAEENVL